MLTQGSVSINTMCCIGGKTGKENALICMLNNHELCPEIYKPIDCSLWTDGMTDPNRLKFARMAYFISQLIKIITT